MAPFTKNQERKEVLLITRNSFIEMTKIPGLKGRISYIISPLRQENLYAVHETTERKFWSQLAKCNQEEFTKSGTEGRCIEARELIIALPEEFVDYPAESMLDIFTTRFKEHYGVECISALHHNKRKTNYHIHLIFSERKKLDEPVEKIATRNMFYDESGKHVRTKKEILGEDGQVRKGCKIVAKGDVYERKLFTTKDARFKDEKFLEEVKQSYTDLINLYVGDDDRKLTVFSRDSAYLPMKKIGKNNPKEAEIIEDNKVRQEWNYSVDEALIVGIDERKVNEVKREKITAEVKNSIEQNGNRPGLFKRIVEKAIAYLKKIIKKWKAPVEPIMTFDIKEFNKLKEIRARLESNIENVRLIEGKVLPRLERELKEAGGWRNWKKREEIQCKIDEAKERLAIFKQAGERIVQSEGYRDVPEFIRGYNKEAKEMLKYNEVMNKYKERGGKMPDKESVSKRLEKARQEAKKRNVKMPTRSNEGRGAR